MTTRIIVQCVANARGKFRHRWYWDDSSGRQGMSARRCIYCMRWWDDVHAAFV